MTNAVSIGLWQARSAYRMALLGWALLVVFAAGLSLGLRVFGELDSSVWNVMRSIPQYFLLALGVSAIAPSMRIFVAIGATRRAVIGGAMLFGAFAAVAAALLMVISGVLLEKLVTVPLGLEQLFPDGDVIAFDRFIGFVLLYLAYYASGVIIAGCYLRLGSWWGTVALVPAVLPALTAEAASWASSPVTGSTGFVISGNATMLTISVLLTLIAFVALPVVVKSTPISMAATSK